MDERLQIQLKVLKTARNNQRVKGRAVQVLGEIGDAQAIEPLMEAFRNSNKHLRWAILAAILKIGGPTIYYPLLQITRDEDNKTSFAAGNYLKTNMNEAVPVLIEVARHDANWLLRANALKLLQESRDARALAPSIQLLNDPLETIRERAAQTLGWLGDRGAVQPLIAALTDSDRWVVARAAYSLGLLNDMAAVEPLLSILEAPRERLGFAIAWVFDALLMLKVGENLTPAQTYRAVEPTINALSHLDAYTREKAAQALMHYGDNRAIPGLLFQVVLGEDDRAVSYYAVKALGQLAVGNTAVARHLETALRNADNLPFQRRNMIESLGAIGDIDSLAIIELYTQDENEFIRMAALQAIENIQKLSRERGIL